MITFRNFLTEAKDKTAVFAFGRMNPPTTGHAKLIKAVMSVAKKEKGIPMVYPSKSEDKKKNPLTYKTKVAVLTDVFGNIINTDTGIKTPFNVLEYLNDKKFSKVVFVVGSDRVDEFKKNMSKFVKSDLENIKEFSVVSAGDRDPDAEGVKGISGSKMRDYVKRNKFKKFSAGLMTNNSKLSKKVFKELQKRMNVTDESIKKEN
jgi:nicotinic acid mononucleotide adenylyltransferase